MFVVIGSLTIAGPVGYNLVGGDAPTQLDGIKDWLAVPNSAVVDVRFLVLGAELIANGLPPLTSSSRLEIAPGGRHARPPGCGVVRS